MLKNQQTFTNFVKINTRNIYVITLGKLTKNLIEIELITVIMRQNSIKN